MRPLPLLLLATAASAQAAATPAAPRPNIVVMMADDLGFADLGCYGSEIETPHIDRLAARGLRFSQFYNTGKCHSSRVSLMSGLYCFQAGNSRLSRAATIPEVLGAAGYFTAMVGKWHLDGEPTDRGFARYFGHLSGATNFFTGDDTFRLNGEKWSDFGDDFYTTDANTDRAMQFVDEAIERRRPFFLYFAHNAPHYPLQAPKETVEKYGGRYDVGWDEIRRARYERLVELGLIDADCALSPRPDYVPAWDRLTAEEKTWESARMAVFAAMVDRIDQNVGRLVAHLKARGAYDDTVIMFCSDNGACPFERTRGKHRDPWDPKSYWCYDVGWAHVGNTPFRWYKQNQHEGGISSPMIVHWPAALRAEAGSITHEPAHLIDVMATCIELAGATYPGRIAGRDVEPLQGKSLVPLLEGRPRDGHDWLYFQFADNRAIRQGDWKLVSARGGPWELYDLATDRSEMRDLATRQPGRVDSLRELWHRVAADVERAPKRLRKPVSSAPKTFPPGQITQREAGPKARRARRRDR